VLAYVPKTDSLYGLTVPGKTAPDEAFHFARYDLGTRKLVLNQPLKGRGLRAIIVAKDGRAWFTNGNGGLDRYDPASNKVQKTSVKVPGDGVLRAASRPDEDGVAYCLSKDGAVFSFDTRTEKVKEITKAFVAGRLYIATCRLDPSGRHLYYIPGAHGKSSQTGTPVIQLDVKTGRRKVIAFLNEHVRKTKNYNLGGTYGIALNADGSQLCINFNGSKLPLQRKPDFGLCATVVLHIPASERTGK
jgi:streptogramin lyase